MTGLVNGPGGRRPRSGSGSGGGGGRRGPIGGRRGEARLADIVDVDPRIEARRAEVRLTKMARRRRWWLAGTIAVTAVVAGYGLTRTSLLDVDDVVVTGAVRTPADEVRAASGVRSGQPLTEVDADRVAGSVRALPWVDSVTVARSWTGSVELAVTERTPVAVVEGDTGLALVDRTRRILAVGPEAPGDLPFVRGVPISAPGETLPPILGDALALARAMPPGLRTRVAAIDVVGDELELSLRPSGRARIGTIDKLDQKVVSLLAMFGQVDLSGLCVVDVSVPATPVLTRQDSCG